MLWGCFYVTMISEGVRKKEPEEKAAGMRARRMVWETYQRIAREIALTAYFSAAVCAGMSQTAFGGTRRCLCCRMEEKVT